MLATVQLKNNTLISKTYGSLEILAGATATLDIQTRNRVAIDSEALTDIAAGDAELILDAVTMTPTQAALVLQGIASEQYFSNIANGFIANTIQAAIEEIANRKNFSYNVIDFDLEIPLKQQMVTYQEVQIQAELTIKGELIVI